MCNKYIMLKSIIKYMTSRKTHKKRNTKKGGYIHKPKTIRQQSHRRTRTRTRSVRRSIPK